MVVSDIGIIPTVVRYNRNLRSLSKVIYCELTSICDINGTICVSNGELANSFGVTQRTISKCISELKKEKYILISNKPGFRIIELNVSEEGINALRRVRNDMVCR